MAMGTFGAIRAAAQIDTPSSDLIKASQSFAAALQVIANPAAMAAYTQQAQDAMKLTQDEMNVRDAASQAVATANGQLQTLNDKMQQVKQDILDAEAKAKDDANAQIADIDKHQTDAELAIKQQNDALKAREDAVSTREDAVLQRENAILDKERKNEAETTSLANQKIVIDGIKADISTRLQAVEKREQKLLNN